MKKIFFFLLFASQLQSQTITFDTSYVKIIDNSYYLVYHADYADGGYYEKASMIGDTSQLYYGALASFENTANNFADKVVALKNNEAFLTGNKWQISALGTTAAVDFNYNKTTSTLRYIVEGSTPKMVFVFSKFAIRLISYPVLGQFIDLYWEEGKSRYISQDGKIWLRQLKPTR